MLRLPRIEGVSGASRSLIVPITYLVISRSSMVKFLKYSGIPSYTVLVADKLGSR